jgi:hypothetical protein
VKFHRKKIWEKEIRSGKSGDALNRGTVNRGFTVVGNRRFCSQNDISLSLMAHNHISVTINAMTNFDPRSF